MKRILISFSGGKTSAYMTKWILAYYKAVKVFVFGKKGKYEYIRHDGIDPITAHPVELIVVMANTGKERLETLTFAKECDQHYGFGINYVESVVHTNDRKRSTHKLVRFNQLATDGQPFERVISKYGIPNNQFPHCTRELKTAPIHSFIKSIGWNFYLTAIGYRNDEQKRLNRKKQAEEWQWYPLADDFPVDKYFINEWWKNNTFTLNLEEHEGNCDMCWKKNIKKLILHAAEKPKIVDWWRKMEIMYGEFTPKTRSDFSKPPYRFFRGNLSVLDIVEMRNKFFAEVQTEIDFGVNKTALLGKDHGVEINDCEESCEPF